MNKNIMKISFFVVLLGFAMQLGATALHDAIQENDLKTVKKLVNDGADINAKDKYGWTPLHRATWNNKIELVQYLVEHKADINAKDIKGKTPFYLAVTQKNKEIIKYLAEKKADIDTKDKDGWTPLHYCVGFVNGKDLGMAKYLVEMGANINAKDNDGWTPLHTTIGQINGAYGSKKYSLEIVQYLVEHGSDINATDNDGRTPFYVSVFHEYNLDIAQYLIKKGANINTKAKDGNAPIHKAVWVRNIKIVSFLVENGADVNVKNNYGETPLYYIIDHYYVKDGDKSSDIMKYLIKNGAEIPSVTKDWENDLLDVYLLSPEKTRKYIDERSQNEDVLWVCKEIKVLNIEDYNNKLGIKNFKANNTVSINNFEINSKNIIRVFNDKLESKLNNRFSVHRIITKEKEIIKNGNYTIAHGRSTKFDRFVNDQTFLYLMDIFNVLSGNEKEIDKTSHYTQHYVFPGEKWTETTTSSGFLKMTITVHDFRGLTINLPQSKVADLVKTGITSPKGFSYERSTLQFGANLLGAKNGSSPLDYVFSNGNVDETRGSVTIENLFKRLGKMVGKDLSNYYKKYEKAFELICKAGEKFEHGTLLLYEFTPKTLQEYVKVTQSSGGHINNEDSGILIKGKRTTDPKKVLDTLINNPEDFDEPTHDYEFFWPLTDEVTANMHSDEVKTYAFHIGKHDEELAKNIKHWIAKVFERIKCDMAQDGIIKYSPVQKSKL